MPFPPLAPPLASTLSGLLSRLWIQTLPLLLLAACGSSTANLPAEDHQTRLGAQRDNFSENIRSSEVSFDMVWIPQGGFWIGKHEVTWDEYLLYCDFEEKKKVPPGVDAVTKPSKPQEDVAPYDRGWGTDRRPAVGMSWNAAKKYCKWLSLNTGHRYRLPTEKEWLLALGSKSLQPIGDHAWYRKNSGFMTHGVGKRKPNEHGLHDMFGNLWEYCGNPWSATQPKRAVLRGGGWSSRAGELTSTKRLGFDPDWVLEDPNVPAGVWWVPDGGHLGMRVLRVLEIDKSNK